MFYYNATNIEELIGKTFTTVRRAGESIIFEGPEGNYSMYHSQSCCESVELVDFDEFDLRLLENNPILYANLTTQDMSGQPYLGYENRTEGYIPTYDYAQWTFYNISTIKGTVNFRWIGESNGYYSIDVGIVKLEN